MDGSRFDNLVASLVDAGSSRRSLVRTFFGGGIAAALSVIGISALDVEDAQADKKSCLRHCKHKSNKSARKQCRKKCKKPNNTTNVSFNITNAVVATGPGGICTVGTNAGCPAGSTCLVG